MFLMQKLKRLSDEKLYYRRNLNIILLYNVHILFKIMQYFVVNTLHNSKYKEFTIFLIYLRTYLSSIIGMSPVFMINNVFL